MTSTQKLLQLQNKQKQIFSKFLDIGFIWQGTIIWRYLTCGRDGCSCMKDPSMRHGPYPYWTTKKSGKTISRKLSAEEAEILEPWIENRRIIENMLEEMKEISEEAFILLRNIDTTQ